MVMINFWITFFLFRGIGPQRIRNKRSLKNSNRKIKLRHTLDELDDIVTNPKQTPEANLTTPETAPLMNLSTVDYTITNKDSLITDESTFYRRNLITSFND